MAARARTRPRGVRASGRPRRGQPFFKSWSRRVDRQALAAAAAAVLIVGVVAVFFIDVPGLLADMRDWVLGRFGLALLIFAGWGAAAVPVVRHRHRKGRDAGLIARRGAGLAALGLFLWGALALNYADWTFGSVKFNEVSLGGTIGEGLIGGLIRKVTWLSLFIIAAAMLAPRPTLWFARNAPLWVETAWDRRWPHRIVFGIWAAVVWLFKRPTEVMIPGGHDDEQVIGAAPLRDRLERPASDGIVFRPTIDPSNPSVPERPVPAPVVAIEEPVFEAPPAATAEDPPEEPVQLGLGFSRPGGWAYPAIDMLNTPQPSSTKKHDNAARAQLIVDTLASFGVDATVVEVNEGPTVTQFGVEPGWEIRYRDMPLKDASGKSLLGADGRPRSERLEISRTRVRVNKITALQNDLALALAAPSLRIEAPVPGRAIVGIEVPNDTATVVSMRNVMETKEFSDLVHKSKLALALGRGVSGVPVVADLGKMPHLLIAGATGSGKSVCINSIIGGILMNASPDEVRFVMVDPKRVELTGYGEIPHLAFSEVIVDMDKVVGTLQAVVSEMESRYKRFAAVAVRNIEAYNRHPRVLKKVPYWVVIIDELADLMMAAPFEVEKLICRLAQLARATGIHLVVATQRPSVDVVTGLIKANFPTRIAFAVTSMTDSRTILDMGGAEKLLGKGDMLFMPTDVAKPIRIQGVYVSDAEIERLVEFWTDDRFRGLAPETADDLLQRALIEQNGGDEDMDVDEDDPVVGRARELVSQHNRVSPSLFQRRLGVGYVKACKLIEILEGEGAIGPREDGESRRVLQTSAFGDD